MLHNSDSNHCIAVQSIRMGENNNPYFVVLMSCWSSWFHSKEVSNKVASAVNFIQTQRIVSSGLHFSLYNNILQVFKCTLQVFKCTDDALRVSYELHHIGSTPGKVLFKVLFFALFLGKTLFLVLLLVLKKVTELFFALFLAPFSALFLELFFGTLFKVLFFALFGGKKLFLVLFLVL